MTANLKALVQRLGAHERKLMLSPDDACFPTQEAYFVRSIREELAREIERMESESGARTAETPETGALKPCPFCGGKARFVKAAPYARIECQNKQCGATNGLAHTRDQAHECWNRRTP